MDNIISSRRSSNTYGGVPGGGEASNWSYENLPSLQGGIEYYQWSEHENFINSTSAANQQIGNSATNNAACNEQATGTYGPIAIGSRTTSYALGSNATPSTDSTETITG